ncbi:MAG TPA: hypothetical protein VN843_25785 [Anaerolineales bacterium]|nr:hypothetical protein [Anaerolineales bacterium]
MRTRRYSELRQLQTFEQRFEYLSLGGEVGQATFGFDRWMNQNFYRSYEWRVARDEVIVRDNGCDLGIPGYEIGARLLVHHMNPVTPEALRHGEAWILDPEFLITTTHRTHNAIHFGDDSLLVKPPIVRRPGDTKLW